MEHGERLVGKMERVGGESEGEAHTIGLTIKSNKDKNKALMFRIRQLSLCVLLVRAVLLAISATDCPAGFACEDGKIEQCQLGQYSPASATVCLKCPAGFKCELPSLSPIQCDAGFYSQEGQIQCTICEKGHYCAATSVEQTPCASPASYAAKKGSQRCKECPPGHRCPSPSEYPVKCEMGSYSLEGHGVCHLCPPGYECLSISLAPQRACSQGEYSLLGHASCQKCPAGKPRLKIGHQCPTTTELPIPCPDGFYAPSEATACSKCPAGFKCEDPELNPMPCIIQSQYSLEGSTQCAMCPQDHECPSPDQPPRPCNKGMTSESGVGICSPLKDTQEEQLLQEFFFEERMLLSPCSTGFYPDPTNSNTCVECPAGKFCADGYYYIRDCPQGTYSLAQEQQCTLCPAGSECPTTTASPVGCDAGQFSLQGSTMCVSCPAGYQCPNSDGTSITYCQGGTYSTGSATACSQCPIDHFCNAFQATACHTSMFSPLGDYQCYWCPAGYSCNKAAGTMTACASGEYSLDKHLSCTACPAGFYCPNAGEAPVACPPNQFSSAGATACTDCGTGKYSFIGWTACETLPSGHYVASGAGQVPQTAKFGYFANGQTAMSVCTAGTLCALQSSVTVGTAACPAGHYCEVRGSTHVGPVACPAGTFRASNTGTAAASSDCTTCTIGSYCLPGTITPSPCPKGYFCPAGTKYATENPCADGTWSTSEGATSQGGCAACPAGFSCSGGIKNYCEPGYYCVSGNTPVACSAGTYQPYHRQSLSTECLTCPVGHYCPTTAMHTPTPCPAGTYNANTGSSVDTACVSCDAGSVCPKPMNRYNDKRFFCEPGHYCPAGTQNPRPQPCPAHYYSDRTDLTQASECTRCPEGYWCPEGATFLGQGSKNVLDVDNVPGNKPILCPEGWYCPLNGDAQKCPAGSWNPTRGAFLLAHCRPCPAGNYCLVGTGSLPIRCTTHTYCPPATASPISCPGGTYSPHDNTMWPSYMAATHVSDCFPNHPGYYGRMVACPVNTYNPFFWGQQQSASSTQRGCYSTPGGYSTNGLTAQITPSPCPIGKYSASGSSCSNCPAGYYCDEFALSQAVLIAEKECPAGYYCPGGATGERFECSVGYFCVAKSSAQTKCSSGTWSFNIRQGSACPQIIAGYYHDTAAHSAVLCPQGKYCPAGTIQSTIQACGVGTFNPYLGAKSSAYCTPCPIGFICNDASGTIDPTTCPVGKYCPRGSSSGTNCPAGTFSNSEGLKQESDCNPCWAGSYCATTGLSAVSGQCDAGSYCPAGSTSATQTVCQKHAYCPAGIAYPTNCAPGQYSSSTGQSTSGGCTSCPAGSYCTGLADPQNCAAGYYCTGGSSTPFQNVAEVGKKAEAGASTQTTCPSRRYNFDIAQSSCTQCPPGYYCTSGILYDCYTKGTASTTDDDYNQYCEIFESVSSCPAGTYSNHPNSQSQSAFCKPCLPGYKCSSPMILSTPAVILTLNNDDYEGGQYGWEGTGHTTPAGYASETAEASFAFACPPGTYNSATGSTDLACTALGNSLASLGGYAYGISCADGYQCLGSAKQVNPELCEKGYKCVQGVKTACAAGEYQPLAGKNYCLSCKKGYYCSGAGTSLHTPTICEAGKYCPEGASSATNCPEGTYNPSTGRYDLTHCLSCEPGYYCPATTSSLTGLDCPAGKYCNYRAGNAYSGTCAIGQFCPLGSVLPTECTPGKYCGAADLGAESGNCDAGYYCTLSATTSLGSGQCPSGTYCPAQSALPSPCLPGTFSNAVGATQSSDCQQCTAGKYCDKPLLTAPAGDCAERFYCPQGALSKYQNPCPAGSKCVAGMATPTDCATQAGYQPRSHSNSCIACPSGYTCSSTAKTECDYSGSTAANKYCANNVATDCPAGQIIDFPGAGASSDCISCPPGNYCDNGSTKIQVCTGGNQCEGGASSNAGSGPCPEGSYCPDGKRKLLCTAGRYCQGTGSSTTQPCPAGSECQEGTGISTTTPCPAGSYCPEGTAFGLKCPPGTYLGSTGNDALTDCVQCDAGQFCKGRGLTAPNSACLAGFYCPTGSVTEYENLCGEGHKCPVNSASQTPCEANTYQGAKGQATCFACPVGYQCLSTQMTTVTICAQGSVCNTAGAAPSSCPLGTYGPTTGLAQCISCYPGSYCGATGLTSPSNTCDAGHVCILGATSATPTDGTTGKTCPKGYYCTGGTVKEVPCPPGKYGTTTGLKSESECSSCPVGRYCPKYGMTDTDVDNFLCSAGYFCSGGATIPTPTSVSTGGQMCSKGKKCLEGATAETPCELGTYNPVEGQSVCRQCPKGFKCDSTGLVAPVECEAGHFCPAGASSSTACAAGTYSDRTKLSEQSHCKECEPGYFCTGGESASTQQCQQGYACPGGASTATPSGVYSKTNTPRNNGQCPKGHYCPTGTDIPKPCERGKYQPSEGQHECLDCPEGKYCHEIGLWDASSLPDCADGFHCIKGNKVDKPNGSVPADGGPCAAGSYCLKGLSTQCAAGTYEPRTGSSACQQCPAGYKCVQGATSPTICPIYYFCAAGSSTGELCPDGTRNTKEGLEASTQCEPCPMGFYCQNGGQVESRCTAGYFCKSGAAVATPADTTAAIENDYSNGPCPTGHYCPNTSDADAYPQQCPTDKVRITQGAAAASDCQDCPQGYFCPAGLNQAIPCPQGYYCEALTQEPTRCPVHTFGPTTLITSLAGCIDCNDKTAPSPYNDIYGKTYCNAGTNDPPLSSYTAYLCPPGNFCAWVATGTLSTITPCPVGTFSAGRGARDSCDTCTAGSYCLQGQKVPIRCAQAKYCPPGSSAELTCPAGFLCPENTGVDLSSSNTNTAEKEPYYCPEAYYCPEGSLVPIKCVNGFYCPAGSATQTECPQGEYGSNNPHNIDSSTGCITCDRGTYTDNAGVTECQVCTAGYVCTGGTNTATPTNASTDNGYICPVGHYCPAGSFKEIECASGTYNPFTGKSASSDCLPCPENTYNDKTGQDGCLKCAGSAKAAIGSTACSCDGHHRVYQPDSGACVCATGFQIQLGDAVDSTEDCIPEATAPCSAGQIRSELGRCVSITDCSGTCGSSGGRRIQGIGMCNCASVQYVESVCDSSCLSSAPNITITQTGLVQRDSGTAYNLLATNTQITGSFTSCPENQSCKLISIVVDQTTGISASYNHHAGLLTSLLLLEEKVDSRALSEVRELTASNTVQNPIVCVHTMDTFIFNVEISSPRADSVYPIYVQESVLNTDSNFDNSAFLQLQDRILNTDETFTFFAYQFVKEGLFVFATSQAAQSYMLVRVLPTSQSCPSPQYFIQPLTEENLLSVGVQSEVSRPENSNWPIYGWMIFYFVCILMGLFLLIALLHAAAIAREKEALLEEDELELTCWERCCPCIKSRRRKDKDGEGNEFAQKELTLDDLREIKDLASNVKEELLELYEQENDEFGEIYKNSKKLNKKLQKMAEMNGLKVEEDLLGMERERQRKLLEQGLGIDPETGLDKTLLEEQEDEDFKQKLEEEVQRDLGTIEEQVKEFQEEDTEQQRKELNEKLQKMKQLNDEEKRALLLEQETNIARAKNLLKVEAQKQESELSRKINERKAKRALLQERIKEEEMKKREAEKLCRDQVEFERERADQDIKNLADLEELKRKELGELEADFNETREKKKDELKQALQEALAKAKPSQRPGVLMNFDQAQQKLLRAIDREKRDGQEYIKDNIQEIAQRKREQRKKEFEEVRERLQADRDTKMGAINEEIDRLKKLQDNEEVDTRLMEVEIYNQEQRRKAQLELRRKHQLELRKLKKKEQEELDKVEQSLEEGEKEIAQTNEKSAAVRDEISRNQIKRQVLEQKLQDLQGREDPESEKEKQRILAQLGSFDQNIIALERDLNGQKQSLQEKLMRRKKNLKKKMEKRQQFEGQMLMAMEKQKKEDETERMQKLNEDFQKIVHRIQLEYKGEELTYAMEKAIDSKQAEELKILLSILLNEKFEKLKLMLDKLLQDKLDELRIVKEEFAPRFEELEDEKSKGRLVGQNYRQKFKELQEEEQERKKDLDLKYFEKQTVVEENISAALDEQHDKELLRLKEKQIEEKNGHMKRMLSKEQRSMKVMEQERRAAMERELADYKDQLNMKMKKKLEEKELERAKLIQMQRESEERMKQFEQEASRANMERELKERERMEKRRAEIEERRRKLDKDLNLRGDLSEAMKRELMRKHEEELKALEGALEVERRRQQDILGQKLQERKMLKQKYKEERDRKLAVFKLHKEKMIDQKLADVRLPSFAGAQSQFEKVVATYANNVKVIEKLSFPHKLTDKEARGSKQGAKGSQSSADMTGMKESFIFGKLMGAKKKGSKKLDLKAVLDKLNQIEGMLNS